MRNRSNLVDQVVQDFQRIVCHSVGEALPCRHFRTNERSLEADQGQIQARRRKVLTRNSMSIDRIIKQPEEQLVVGVRAWRRSEKLENIVWPPL